MEPSQSRICVCFIISGFLIGCVIYVLLSSFLDTAKRVGKLEGDVNDVGMMVSQGGACGQIDNEVKHCIASLRNELDELKKLIGGQSCSNDVPALSTGGCGGAGCALDTIAHSKGTNYASEELGARIENVVGEPVAPYGWMRAFLGMKYSTNPPINMLRNNMEPGNCFAFRNTTATVTIRLAQEIFVESFELEHLCKERIPNNDTSNAPRDFEVLYMEAASCATEHSLGQFVFENKSPLQYYLVKSEAKAKFVRFKFLSNHGNPAHTCIYRVAVYGRDKM